MSGDREAIRPTAATTAVLSSKCRRDPQQVGFALPEAVECSEAATASPGELTARMGAGRFCPGGWGPVGHPGPAQIHLEATAAPPRPGLPWTTYAPKDLTLAPNTGQRGMGGGGGRGERAKHPLSRAFCEVRELTERPTPPFAGFCYGISLLGGRLARGLSDWPRHPTRCSGESAEFWHKESGTVVRGTPVEALPPPRYLLPRVLPALPSPSPRLHPGSTAARQQV